MSTTEPTAHRADAPTPAPAPIDPVALVAPVRMGPRDIFGLGLLGLRMRKARAVLSALGICVGIATMVIVTGIPASSQHALLQRLTALGTDILKVEPDPNQTQPVALPQDAAAMAARIGPVTATSQVANLHMDIRRTYQSDPDDSAAVTVLAAQPTILSLLGGSVHSGRFLSAGTDALPVVVLGYQAATILGYQALPSGPQPQLYIDGRWFTLIGILNPMPVDPDLEQAAFVGWSAAKQYLDFSGDPTVVYAKSRDDAVDSVKSVLAATVSPAVPGLVQVTNPADALAAQRATQSAYSTLFVGLAAVALLVGGIGVANTMVVSVLERRREIGLRRALGASRGHIRSQFLMESVLLSSLGGIAGAFAGALSTAVYAEWHGWSVVVPVPTVLAGIAGALVVGILAGLYPAAGAARLTPTEALATT